MKKYKQKIIPETSQFNAKGKELSLLMRKFYKENLQGKTIVVVAKIDGVKRYFRISVKLKTDMKAYYNHTVNRYSGDNI